MEYSRNTIKRLLLPLLVFASAAMAGPGHELEDAVNQATTNGSDHAGYSLAVFSTQARYGAYSGWENPDDETPITGNTAFRLASITKTYVASTVLRLWEEGMVDLQSPISKLIDPQFNEWLQSDGYDIDKILLRHLLTHTGGVFDHAQDRYIEILLNNPETEWTRAGQVKAGVDWGDPVGKPGELFYYSDTGYILVGNIIERITGKTLSASVRQWVNFEKLGIKQTYWERFENPPANVNRAHQHFQGMDTYNWSPTIDVYGGGGLVATPADVALFFNKLLTGQVFKNRETLSLMLSKEGLPENSPYRIGMFEFNYDGKQAYGHYGYWGTLVAHDPITNKTIAGAVVRGSDNKLMQKIITAYIRDELGVEDNCFAPDSQNGPHR